MRNLSRRQYAVLRKGIYVVAPALSAVLVAFGVWTSDQAVVVTGAVTAILSTVLAFFNTDPGMYEDAADDASAESAVAVENRE
nr:MAG TPA: putative phage holin Dp-1 [Caudoviricetes sp.]